MPSPYAASNMAFVNALRGVLRLGPLYRTEGKERDELTSYASAFGNVQAAVFEQHSLLNCNMYLGIDMQTETVEA